MRGKERRDIAFDRLDVFVRIGAGEIEKDARDAAEKLPGALQRDDRILERRRRRIIRDGGDLGFMRRERLREGGGKIIRLDRREWRQAKRAGPVFEQRILGVVRHRPSKLIDPMNMGDRTPPRYLF